MQFNDTSNLNGLIQSCEDWTGLGDGQISGDTTMLKRFTRLINTSYHKIVTMILDSQDESDFDDVNHGNTGFIKTYNLTADTQSILLPASDKILKLKRVEVTYDGVTWRHAQPIDINEYGGTADATTVNGLFSVSEPYYDVHGSYIFLYPIPTANVTGGLKIWASREIDEFTTADTTQEPGIAEPFHEFIALDASLTYGSQHGLANTNVMSVKAIEYEARLRNFYGTRQEDRVMVMKNAGENYD